MKKKLTSLFLVLVLAIGLIGCGGQPTKQDSVSTSPEKEQKQSQPVAKEEQSSPIKLIPGTVTKIVDGDTAYIKLSNGKEEKVRFIGVDTPETKHPSKPVQPYGPEASNYTTEELSGKQVYLEKDATERDKYGRLLSYIWLGKPTTINDTEIRTKMFNARLLMDGYAQLMTIPPNVKYVDYFTKYQTEAREANKGLWGINPSTSSAVTPANPPSSPAPVKQTPAPSTSKKELTVYITATGAKYHRAGCRYLRKSQYPMNLSEAKASGYDPCSVCSPPY